MSRVTIGAVLAAIAMFIWGFMFWGVSPLPYSVLERVADDAETQAALLDHFPASGAYLIPGNMSEEAVYTELHEAGPVAFVQFSREGRPVMAPSVFLYGFLHMLVTAFLIGWLLRMAAPGLHGYLQRLGFVTIAGLAASFFAHVGAIVWWGLPAGWILLTAVYDLTAWIVAGFVLAGFASSAARDAPA
ncbi:hypothetical protein BH24PSE2_BH24PSE2_24470 [soil metagenome]